MKKRRSGILIVLLVLALTCTGIFVFAVQTKIFQRLYDNVVLDNWNHYLPCDALPTENEVNQVLEQHQDTLQAIEQVNPGFVGVEVDAFTCPGRADLLIWYATHQDRLAIEKIMGKKTFFGIPIRMENR